MIGARQAQLGLVSATLAPAAATQSSRSIRVRPFPLLPRLSDAERAAHAALIATLGARAIWNEYRREVTRAASE
jgi:DNA polymerase-3 subunit epsilon